MPAPQKSILPATWEVPAEFRSRLGEKATGLRDAMPDLADRMQDTPCEVPPAPSIFLVDAPTAPVSSTGVRQSILEGAGLERMVPAAVAAHIERYRLYRESPFAVGSSKEV